MIFLGKVNLLCLFELKLDFLMSGIYFYLSRKNIIFLGKSNIHCLFFYIITPKKQYTSGAVSIRPKNAIFIIDGAGGGAEGQTAHFCQKKPTLLGPGIGFNGASVNSPFHTPRKGGSAREARRPQRGGRLAFNAFLALTKWPFSAKMILLKCYTIHDTKY